MKYFKHKTSDLVIEVLDDQYTNYPLAKVVVAGNAWEIGDTARFDLRLFEPCEAPQSTQTDKPIPNYTKDAQLRLKCLKLAIQSNQGVWQSPETVTTDAQHYYNWITE